MSTVDWRLQFGSNGAIWGTETEDLNATLVRWEIGDFVSAHRNDEVDVIVSVISGTGNAVVDGVAHPMFPGAILVIPKGTVRAITPSDCPLVYLNIHKRRRKLLPTMTRPDKQL